MVRVGGGWTALDEFLVRHDPCRGNYLILILNQCETKTTNKTYSIQECMFTVDF